MTSVYNPVFRPSLWRRDPRSTGTSFGSRWVWTRYASHSFSQGVCERDDERRPQRRRVDRRCRHCSSVRRSGSKPRTLRGHACVKERRACWTRPMRVQLPIGNRDGMPVTSCRRRRDSVGHLHPDQRCAVSPRDGLLRAERATLRPTLLEFPHRPARKPRIHGSLRRSVVKAPGLIDSAAWPRRSLPPGKRRSPLSEKKTTVKKAAARRTLALEEEAGSHEEPICQDTSRRDSKAISASDLARRRNRAETPRCSQRGSIGRYSGIVGGRGGRLGER